MQPISKDKEDRQQKEAQKTQMRLENERKEREENGEINQTLLVINFKITPQERTVAGCFLNVNDRLMLVTEFLDNEHLSSLESFIIQMNNSSSESKFKVLVNMPNDLLKDKVKDLLTMCEVDYMTASNRKDFDSKMAQQTLASLLKENINYKIEESEMDLALGCLQAGVEYLGIRTKRQFILKKYTLGQYLRLDVAALKALNVFPASTDVVCGQAGSLYGLLNQTKTTIGARLLKKWLKQPTTELEEINARHEIVEFLVQNDHMRSDIQSVHLRTFPDLERLYAKFYRVQAKLRHNAQLIDCVKVYNMIHTLESLCTFVDENVIDEKHAMRGKILDPLKSTLEEFQKLKAMLEECIDIGKAKQNDYIINADFSPELRELATEIEGVRTKMEKLKQHVQQDLGTSKCVELVESGLHTFMFEVDKKEGDAGVRKSKNQYKIISIKNRIMSFTCAELKELVRDYNELEDNYKAQQDELVQKVLEIASTYYPLLERVSIVISQLDVLAAFAQVSNNFQYVRPTVTPAEVGSDGENPVINLRESRHPLIEVQDPSQCISNDTHMEKGRSNLQIITGPNMGGKSTYIRQVATSVLLAHIGCFVPCSAAEIPVIDCIIARVGASDHQLRGISTFMAEMLEASCMLKTATKNSLIIMDELGRGTSTNEGFGLAWAIAEHIAKEINCYCQFATHFHEMTAMERELSNVKNLYVSALAEGDKLTMLYKVKQGVIDRSYGIHVAEMLKFPKDVLDEAKKLAAELENFNQEYEEEAKRAEQACKSAEMDCS